MGTDVSHPKGTARLEHRIVRRHGCLLGKGGAVWTFWPVQATTLLVFLIPKNVTGERSFSKRSKVRWDDREGSNG